MNALDDVYGKIFVVMKKHKITVRELHRELKVSKPTLYNVLKHREGNIRYLTMILEYIESKSK